MTEYQKQQEAAGRRQERRERRELATLRRLKQDAAGKLDKPARAGAQAKIQETSEEERESLSGRGEYERAPAGVKNRTWTTAWGWLRARGPRRSTAIRL
jgi:hypothetical protein